VGGGNGKNPGAMKVTKKKKSSQGQKRRARNRDPSRRVNFPRKNMRGMEVKKKWSNLPLPGTNWGDTRRQFGVATKVEWGHWAKKGKGL